jgi:thymidine kinase
MDWDSAQEYLNMVDDPRPTRLGSIEVICGSMFSGKTEELIRRLRRALIARQRVQIFQPRIDDRFALGELVSHNKARIEAVVVSNSADILAGLDDRTAVVGIDEVQFLDEGVVEVCQKLADEGRRVIVAGLDQDYMGRPFEPIPTLMAVAEYVTKALAVCMQCGAPANRSQRTVPEQARVVVGATDSYEARCRHCFDPELSRQTTMKLYDEAPPSQGNEEETQR